MKTQNSSKACGSFRAKPLERHSWKPFHHAFLLLSALILFPTLSHAQPYRVWGTYYGGSGNDYGNSVAVDSNGFIYMAGWTNSSTNIATPNAHKTTYGPWGTFDAFLVKFDSNGTRLWATYYGAGGDDRGNAIAVASDGSVYLTGETNSTSGIASPSAHQTTPGAGYLAKFDSQGIRQWATYYFGRFKAVAVANDGSVYAAGHTSTASNVATPNAHQTSFGGWPGERDAFLVKFDSNGTRLWATYYGGTGIEVGEAVAVDPSSNDVYLAGVTSSMYSTNPNIIAQNGHQNNYGGAQSDAFLVKFNSLGNRLWATYYGGNGGVSQYSESARAIAVHPSTSEVYLGGFTDGTTGIATPGGHQTSYGGWQSDGFLVKFNASGSRLWATYYGGNGGDQIYSVVVNPSTGDVYAAGLTESTNNIATPGSFKSNMIGNSDAFLVKFNSLGTRIWSTYYGGNYASDTANSLALDVSKGAIYLAGSTETLYTASDIAQQGHQNSFGGGSSDAFLARLTELFMDLSAVPSCATIGQPVYVVIPYQTPSNCFPIFISASNVPTGLNFTNNGTFGTLTGTISAPGTYNFTVSANNSCSITATYSKQIQVASSSPTLPNFAPQNGMTQQPFSLNLAGSGGATPLTYSINPPLPSGLTLNATTGVISGTPTTSASTTHTVTVTDNCGNTASTPLTLNIIGNQPCSPLNLFPTASPASCNSIQFNWFTISGCNGYHMAIRYRILGTSNWTTINPPFPAIPFGNNYILTGLTSNTTYQIQIQSTPSNSSTVYGQWIWLNDVTLSPCPPTINGPASPTACQNTNTTIALTATNSPTSWALIGGTPPAGMTFNTSSGQLGGTPTATGTFSLTFTATNSNGTSAPFTMNLTVNPVPTITSAATVSATTGQSFTYTLTTINANVASITPITPAPSLTISGNTITGTPSSTGSYTYALNATNSCGTVSNTLTVLVIPPAPVITSPASPTACQNTNTTIALTATNSPTSWALIGGTPPAGMTFNTSSGQLNGTPTATGTFSLTFTATNSNGTSAPFTMNLTVNPLPTITSAGTASATQGLPFNYTITATNSPTSFSATGLPAGLTVNGGTGVITGTPTSAGTFSVTLTATNSCGPSSPATLVLTVQPSCTAPNLNATATASGCNAIQLNWTAVGSCTANQFLAIRYRIGTNPWVNVPNASRPAVNANTYTITGLNPTTTYQVQIQVVSPQTATPNASLWQNLGNVTTPSCTPLPVIPAFTLPNAGQGGSYSFTPPAPTIAAGCSPATWSATGLPAGLTINPSTGQITGTPTVSGTFNVNICVTDSCSGQTCVTKTLVISAAPVIPAFTLPGGTQNVAYSFTPPAPTIAAGCSPATWSATGLPAGLTINPSTGQITGTPTVSGTFNVNICVTDSCGGQTCVTQPLTITPGAPPVIDPLPGNLLVVEAGVPIAYQFTASNSPTAFMPIGPLPAGTALSMGGLLTGAIPTVGNYTMALQATNGNLGPIYSLTIQVIPANAGVLCRGTYYGGTGSDRVLGVATDASGAVYFVGVTTSPNAIAQTGGYQTSYGGGLSDGFVVKMDAFGQRLWATYLGGAGEDSAQSVAVDTQGNVYVAGLTKSTGLGLNGFQNSFGGGTQNDAFLARLTPSTGNLVWLTYYGTTFRDDGLGVATDSSGNIYLTGRTQSTTGIATAGAVQIVKGAGVDAFVAKFGPAGNRLWGSYFGAGGADIALDAAVDSQGNVVVVGQTNTAAGLMSGGHQTTYGGGAQDGFVVKLASNGGSILWRTYFGGAGADVIRGVAVDSYDAVVVSGETSSLAGIASGGHQNAYGGGALDGMVAKFTAQGALIWSSYYGGAGSDAGGKVAVDAARNVYLAGQTDSLAGIAAGGHQNVKGAGVDGFLVKFSPNGARLWATYYGNGGQDYGVAAAVDAFSSVYLVGYTNSPTGMATAGAHQASFGGGLDDGFVVKFGQTGCSIGAPVVQPPASESVVVNTAYSRTFTATNSPTSIVMLSPLPPGLTYAGTTLSGTPTVAGTYTLQLQAVNAGGPGPVFTFTLNVTGVVVPNLVSARILATHGTAGTFGINLPLVGPQYGIDPRRHTVPRTIELTFDVPVTSADLTVLLGTMTLGTETYAGNQILIPVASISPNQKYILDIDDVNATGQNYQVTFGLLQGDVNGNKTVTIVPDRSTVDANGGTLVAPAGTPVNATNFIYDLNADGLINNLDRNLVSGNLGGGLP